MNDVVVWFYTRRANVKRLWLLWQRQRGYCYKSYFWIIHLRPPATRKIMVGEWVDWSVRTHIYVLSVRLWQLVTAPLTKGYWFISLSSKQRFILLYTFVDGLVEKNMITVKKKCFLSKRHVLKTTSRVIYYMYSRIYYYNIHW